MHPKNTPILGTASEYSITYLQNTSKFISLFQTTTYDVLNVDAKDDDDDGAGDDGVDDDDNDDDGGAGVPCDPWVRVADRDNLALCTTWPGTQHHHENMNRRMCRWSR